MNNPTDTNITKPSAEQSRYKNGPNLVAWISLIQWKMGRTFWLLLGAFAIIPTLFYTETFFHKSKLKLQEQIQSIQKQNQVDLERRATLANSLAQPMQELRNASVKLDLPNDNAANIAPLERYFRSQQTKGLEIRQIDYQWPTVASNQPKSSRVPSSIRKVEVSIQMRGDYPAVRAWLGTILLEAPNIQLTNLQIQRQSKDQGLVACNVSLAVFYQVLL